MALNIRFTPMADIRKAHERAVDSYNTGKTLSLAWRRAQLLQLGKLVQENQDSLLDAMATDLGKPHLETAIADLGPPVYAISQALSHLEEWAAPDHPSALPEWRSNWDTTVHKTPKGAVLIITPWNYPYVITLCQLIGAIAAGCTAVIKPSEGIPTVCKLFAELFPRYLDSNTYIVVNGAVDETTELLKLRWDHIIYTGSTRVGRIVATAAAQHLTPVMLELGSKSPVVVDDDVDLKIAARRIIYGKQANGGQICVSPDYVLVSGERQEALIDAIAQAALEQFPKGSLASPDFANIINATHHRRLVRLLSQTRGKVVLGGEVEDDRRLALTVVRDVPERDVLLDDEIFGPILPIVPVESMAHAIRIIKSIPTPLAVYLFTDSEQLKNRFLEQTESGALVLNDTYQQVAVQEMPFGGKGQSGYGAWQGKTSFDTFTHLRSYINVPFAAEPMMKLRYPPYTQEAFDALAGFGLGISLPAQ